MFDASKNSALKCQPNYFSVNFFDMDGLSNRYTIWCFVGKEIHNKDLSWSKSEKSLHQAISEQGREHNACVIRRFTHRSLGNGESDASIAFWLRKDHSAGKPLPQLAIREDATFLVQNWTKKLFFLPIKTRKLILTLEWYYTSLYCRSNQQLKKMANLKVISSSATLMRGLHKNWFTLNLGILRRLELDWLKLWWTRLGDRLLISLRDAYYLEMRVHWFDSFGQKSFTKDI